MARLHETGAGERERVILVGLVTDETRRSGVDPDESIRELSRLAETAGAEVAAVTVQHRPAPDPKWFVGKGKAEEIGRLAESHGAGTVIFDQELSAAQVRNLEPVLNAKIIDRTQLILDIFAGRARTREGMLQVELAQLNYLLPRLAGHGRHLSRLGGGIGTRGPGETKLETDRRHIRRRIGELRRQLESVKAHRELHRRRRRKSGVYQAALVGYTNAGKSTLLNRLTEAGVLAEDKLFATLDPTTRMLRLPGGGEVLLTDTVGFIRNLPHELVAAFRSTLEEVKEADLLIHVIDASSPAHREQREVVERVLADLGAGDKPVLVVYNKIDLCSPDTVPFLKENGGALAISAFRDEDLRRLTEAIERKLDGGTAVFRLPAARGDLAALAHRVGEVTERRAEEDWLLLAVRLHPEKMERLGKPLEPYLLERTE
ncbi:MAG: GTPase HflX [Paenibacillaceae bacterium ZCTH02-B3]|nr:MAG: GTPase HflX [Paenibacillaceae bacterium ZCTH02-B3]